MAIDNQQGKKVIKNVQKEDAPGTRVDPYPYLAIVKNNVDPIRAGRIQVWIPDFGGDAEDPKNWRTVSYVSPYLGSTYIPSDGSKTNSWNESPHTYGMWMTPPDINVEVLVIFLSGDPQKGYWFGCVNSRISKFMLPGNSASQYPSTENSSDAVKKTYDAAKKDYGDIVAAPVTEFNSNLQDYATSPDFVNIARPIHEEQYRILTKQGLDRDKIRGTCSSSSQRETPSAVYGISTPGRAVNDPATDPAYQDKVKAGTLKESDYAVKTRKGGHSFIMDDGDIKDENRLIKIRSSSGHQIVLNDSGNSVYISNNIGTVWMEFTAEGRLNFYSANGVDIRTHGNMNLHVDKVTNINSVGKINIKSEDDINIECKNLNITTAENFLCGSSGKFELNAASGFHAQSGSKISLLASGDLIGQGATAKLNSGGGVSVNKPTVLKVNKLNDTKEKVIQGDYSLWIQDPEKILTIVERAPTHEPYLRTYDAKNPVPPQPADPSKNVQTQSSGPQDAGSSTPGKNSAAEGTPVQSPINDKDIRNQPMASEPIGSISKEGATSLFAQIGKNASSTLSSAGSSLSDIASHSSDVISGKLPGAGKYLMDVPSLVNAGLIKSSVTDSSQLGISSNWMQDKCGSLNEFIGNPSLQEQAMADITNQNYNALCSNGIINDLNKNDPAEVAGWLSVTHTMGINGALDYARTGTNSELGNSLFQQGRYAISNEGRVSDIQNG